nr:hypothetical protein [Angustibacter aerolatus]
MAELVFFCGTMDCGKSTLALQVHHNHGAAGRAGLVFTRHDRAGEAVLSTRLGLTAPALEVHDGLDFWDTVVAHRTTGERVDYLICDEAQFYAPEQVDQARRAGRRDGARRVRLRHHQRLPHPAVPRVAAAHRGSPTACRCCRSRRCAGAGRGPRTTPAPPTASWSSRARRSWSATPSRRVPPPRSATRCCAAATTCAA